METGKIKVEIGEKFADCLTGRVYRVGLINKEWVVLESEDGLNQVLTGPVSLGSLYRQVAPSIDEGGGGPIQVGYQNLTLSG